MTLAQLRCFLAIVDAGFNVTLAATRLNATQSGLSKQLKQLEDELSMRLFVRRGRSLACLTPEGEEIVERVRTILTEAANIRTFAANRRLQTNGALCIETTHIQAQCVLPHVLPVLRRKYPEINVELSFSADTNDTDRRRPDADLQLFSTDGRIPAGGVAIPLFRWDPVAVVPPGHPLSRSTSQPTLAQLARFPLITYDTSSTAPLSLAQTFLDAGLETRFAFALRDAEVIKTMARRGMGVGLLAEMGARSDGEEGLDVLPMKGLFPRCTTWAVLIGDRILSAPLAELLSLLSGLTTTAISRAARGETDIPPVDSRPLWPEWLARWEGESGDAVGAHLRLASSSRM